MIIHPQFLYTCILYLYISYFNTLQLLSIFMLEQFIKSVYATEIINMRLILEKQNQICLCGTDIRILKIITRGISLEYKKRNYTILDIQEQEEIIKDTENLLCVMNIGECTGLLGSKLLYYYLEKSTESSTKVLLYSNDCSSLDSLERRVKSRFKDNVHILRNLLFDEYVQLYTQWGVNLEGGVKFKEGVIKRKIKERVINEVDINKEEEEISKVIISEVTYNLLNKQYKISPLIDNLLTFIMKSQYGIKNYDDKTMLDKLNTIHLSLLILCLRKKIEYNTVVREYKKFINKVRELKNVKDEEIIYYYYDLLDFGLINEKGIFMYSEYEFKNYVGERGPLYLKKLMREI